MSYGMLIDQTKCIGCGACTVSCKSMYEKASFGILRTRIKKYETGEYPHVSFRFRKHMCMHCMRNAPCIEDCPVDAISYISGDDGGMVVINVDTCIGCGRCTRACPYGAPDQDAARKKAEKCTLCHSKVIAGEIPYCAESCPVGAIAFGQRDSLITDGEKRAAKLRAEGRTDAHIWGTWDTMVLYLLDKPPSVYNLPAEGYTALAPVTLTKFATPAGGLVAAAALGGHGLRVLRDRRIKITEVNGCKEPRPEKEPGRGESTV